MIATLAATETLWKQGDHDGAWLALEVLWPMCAARARIIPFAGAGGAAKMAAWERRFLNVRKEENSNSATS